MSSAPKYISVRFCYRTMLFDMLIGSSIVRILLFFSDLSDLEDAIMSKELRLIVVEAPSSANPRLCCFHVRGDLGDGMGRTFVRPYHERQEDYRWLSADGKLILAEILDFPGVELVKMYRHQICVLRGAAFLWEEMTEAIADIIALRLYGEVLDRDDILYDGWEKDFKPRCSSLRDGTATANLIARIQQKDVSEKLKKDPKK